MKMPRLKEPFQKAYNVTGTIAFIGAVWTAWDMECSDMTPAKVGVMVVLLLYSLWCFLRGEVMEL